MTNDKAEESVQEQASVETPSTETNAPDEVVETQDSQDNTSSQLEEPNNQQSVDDNHQPTRGERRINSLVQKLKENTAKQDNYQTQVNSPFQQQEDFSNGEMTIDQLNAHVDRLVQMRIGQFNQTLNQSFRTTEFANEAESVGKQIEKDFGDDKTREKVDNAVTELLQKYNTDESGNWQPKVKPSEVYSLVKGLVDGERQAGQSEATTKMAQNINDAAVRPSTRQQENLSTDDLRKMIETNPKAVQKAILEKVGYTED